MHSVSQIRRFLVNPLIVFTFILGLGANVFAQERLHISGDTFNVSVASAGFGPVSLTIANDGSGTVGNITGIPTTGTLTIPAFSFTLVETGVTSENKVFDAAIIIDEASSMRRLEVLIRDINMDFSGAGLVGSLNTPSVDIYGRDGAGTTIAQTTVASGGSVSFSGTSLTFDAASQIALIQAQGGILADIVTSINNTGLSYNYEVILKQRAGSTAAVFATANGTALPLAGADEFDLAAPDPVIMTGGYKLSGALSFSAPGGGGGGGGGSNEETTATDEEINNEVNALAAIDLTVPANVTDEIKAQVTSLVTDASTNANTLAANLATGSATPEEALAAVQTLNAVFSVSSKLNTSGTAQSTQALATAIESISKIFSALATSGPLTADQKASLQAAANTAVTNITGNIAAKTTRADAKTLSVSISSMLRGITNSGGTITPALASNAKATADKLADSFAEDVLKQFFPTLPADGGPAPLTSAQKGRSQLWKTSFSPITITSTGNTPGETVTFVLTAFGYTTSPNSPFTSTFELNRVLDTSKSIDEAIAEAAGEGVTITLGPNANQVNAAVGSSLFHTDLIDARIVPDVMPEGSSLLADGTILFVSDEIGFNVAPAPRYFSEFQSTLSSSFSATTLTNQTTGSYLLETADAKVSLTFAFEDAGTTTGSGTGSMTFGGLTGSPTDADYKLTVTFADGTTQSMLPFVADSNFLDSLELAGFLAEIDRSTGIISFDNGARFKPDFLVRTPTASEQTFLDNNLGDANGISFSNQGDVNGDGLADVKILSAVGVQTLYSLP